MIISRPQSKFKSIFGAALYLVSSYCLAASSSAALSTALAPSDYVNITIENIVVDTNGLTRAASQLSNNIENLANSIEQLSNSETSFSEQDRQSLIAATTSVNQASRALTKLSQQIPAAIQDLTRELPEAIKNTQPQIASISKSIQAASKAAVNINQSLPETLTRGQQIMSEITTDVMQKVTLYIGLVLLLFAFIIGALLYTFYKTSIQPIASSLSDLRAVPQQLADMSAYMHGTSQNLLILEQQKKNLKRRIKNRKL